MNLRFLAFAFSLLLLLPLLVGCGRSYTDQTLASLTAAVFDANENLPRLSEYSPANDEYLDMKFDIAANPEKDVLYLSNNANINDQIGIFKRDTAADAQKFADELEPLFKEYVDELTQIAKLYSQDEIKKLEGAQIRVYGQYVLLTILDKSQTRAVEDAFVAKISG